ncbi:RICIN domain-containing protein [Kitasatospora sp. NPDC101157]|uniref:RICIN domain-containing protein n=1 Tax=Kitasatospora sp. NPDC101157 TaxID=3364098 RepID=UPI003823DB28
MAIDRTQAYMLRNKSSGLYLCTSNLDKNSQMMTQWKREESGSARAAETWLLMPMGNKKYLLAQKSSGLLATPNNGSSNPDQVNTYRADSSQMASQIWIAQERDGSIALQNENGGLYLTPNNFSREPDQVNT